MTASIILFTAVMHFFPGDNSPRGRARRNLGHYRQMIPYLFAGPGIGAFPDRFRNERGLYECRSHFRGSQSLHLALVNAALLKASRPAYIS